jgi:hypothetical protein
MNIFVYLSYPETDTEIRTHNFYTCQFFIRILEFYHVKYLIMGSIITRLMCRAIWEEPGTWGEACILGTLIDEWEGSSGGASLCKDSTKGTLREGFFTREPKRRGFWEICKIPCKRASLSIGALLGNQEGVRLPGLLSEKKSISGVLSWTRRPLKY